MNSNTFSFCYGSDYCENIKVSQSIVDFISKNIIKSEPVDKSEPVEPVDNHSTYRLKDKLNLNLIINK